MIRRQWTAGGDTGADLRMQATLECSAQAAATCTPREDHLLMPGWSLFWDTTHNPGAEAGVSQTWPLQPGDTYFEYCDQK